MRIKKKKYDPSTIPIILYKSFISNCIRVFTTILNFLVSDSAMWHIYKTSFPDRLSRISVARRHRAITTFRVAVGFSFLERFLEKVGSGVFKGRIRFFGKVISRSEFCLYTRIWTIGFGSKISPENIYSSLLTIIHMNIWTWSHCLRLNLFLTKVTRKTCL